MKISGAHFQSLAEFLYKQAAVFSLGATTYYYYSCRIFNNFYRVQLRLWCVGFLQKDFIMSSPASFDLTSPRLKKTIKLRFLFNGHVHAQTFDCGDPGPPLSAPPTTTPASQIR